MEHIERRPKHPGVKVHLSGPECQEILDWYVMYKAWTKQTIKEAGNAPTMTAIGLAVQIAKATKKMLKEFPDLLTERTPEQIAEALEKDKQKILKQQAAMADPKKDWKAVK